MTRRASDVLVHVNIHFVDSDGSEIPASDPRRTAPTGPGAVDITAQTLCSTLVREWDNKYDFVGLRRDPAAPPQPAGAGAGSRADPTTAGAPTLPVKLPLRFEARPFFSSPPDGEHQGEVPQPGGPGRDRSHQRDQLVHLRRRVRRPAPGPDLRPRVRPHARPARRVLPVERRHARDPPPRRAPATTWASSSTGPRPATSSCRRSPRSCARRSTGSPPRWPASSRRRGRHQAQPHRRGPQGVPQPGDRRRAARLRGDGPGRAAHAQVRAARWSASRWWRTSATRRTPRRRWRRCCRSPRSRPGSRACSTPRSPRPAP